MKHLIAEKLETAGQGGVLPLVNVKPLDIFNNTSEHFPALLAVLESRSPKPRPRPRVRPSQDQDQSKFYTR